MHEEAATAASSLLQRRRRPVRIRAVSTERAMRTLGSHQASGMKNGQLRASARSRDLRSLSRQTLLGASERPSSPFSLLERGERQYEDYQAEPFAVGSPFSARTAFAKASAVFVRTRS